MNPYFFLFIVEPQAGNAMGGHASRAAVHMWVFSDEIADARERALNLFKTELWEVIEEKDAFLASQDHIDGLDTAAESSYRKAQSTGLDAIFNYWHRSE